MTKNKMTLSAATKMIQEMDFVIVEQLDTIDLLNKNNVALRKDLDLCVKTYKQHAEQANKDLQQYRTLVNTLLLFLEDVSVAFGEDSVMKGILEKYELGDSSLFNSHTTH